MRRTSVIVWELKEGLDTCFSRAIAWEIMAEQGAFKFKYEGVNRAGEHEVSSLVDPS